MTDSHTKLSQMIIGPWVSQMIAAVIKLGIPDLMQDKSMTVEELANSTGVDSQSLFRTLRALSTVDIVSQSKDGNFSLTEIGQYLRRDVEGSMASMAVMTCDDSHWLPWAKADQSLATGQPVAKEVLGASFWDYLNQNPSEQDNFNRAMTDTSYGISKIISKSFDFGKFKTLVDIGGGQGVFLTSILEAYPKLKGILFDLPSVIDEAKLSAEMTERVSCVKGSFLDTAPGGADLYVLKHIIHDWDDHNCVNILKNIRSVMNPDGSVLIFEMLISQNSSLFATWLDLNMMVLLGGKERTKEEFSDLFSKSGFELKEVLPTQSHLSIIVGKPV